MTMLEKTGVGTVSGVVYFIKKAEEGGFDPGNRIDLIFWVVLMICPGSLPAYQKFSSHVVCLMV